MTDLVREQPQPTLTGARPTWEIVLDDIRAFTPSDTDSIWKLLMADMKARDAEGRRKYGGVPLQAGNGRDSLVDAYQESLDNCVYLRNAMEEVNPRERKAIESTYWDAVDVARDIRWLIFRRDKR